MLTSSVGPARIVAADQFKGSDMEQAEHKTSPVSLILAWGFVGIPLLAGVSQTLINAMKLFN